MISPKVFISSIFILGLSSQMAALACPDGKSPTSIDYIRRDNNRCEGIKSIPIDGGASLQFTSLGTRKLESYGKNISIEVPQFSGGQQPNVSIKSFSDDYSYQLDNFSLSKIKERFRFSWSSYVLKTKEIPPNSLRGLARYDVGAQAVYVPVIIGQKSNNYEFVFYSQSWVKFNSFKIIAPDGKQVYSTNRPNPQSGETIFTWDSSKAPAGRYELQYVAVIEAKNQPGERIPARYIFEHNPNWLQ
jgi:hypothetical protein